MELRHLRYFLAVAEELHFGRAAKRLGIKQPPLSRQIKNLENELGVLLFDRTNRSVELTGSGKYLREAAARLVDQAEQIRNAIGLIHAGTAGPVRIGYVGSAMHSVVPILLRRLQERHPLVYPEFRELDGDAQVRALRSGEIDVGFVRTPIRADGLALRVLLEETFALVLPADHPLTAKSNIPLRAFAEEPFIGFCRACAPGMADQIVQICNDAGFSPRIVHETTQLNALLRLVESGLGYSIVPSSVRAGYNLRLRFAELGDVPQRAQLAAAYHPQQLSSTAETLMSLVDGLGTEVAPPSLNAGF